MGYALDNIGTTKTDEHARYNGDVQFMIITGDICRHGTDELEDPMHETEHILKGISGPLSNSSSSSSTIGNLNIIKERGISVIPSIGNIAVNKFRHLTVNFWYLGSAPDRIK